MFLIDYLSFYKQTVRMLLIYKLNFLNNSYALPQITKLQFYFALRQLTDVDEVQIYNYFYLFKYFFGISAFLTKTKSFFNVGNEPILLM